MKAIDINNKVKHSMEMGNSEHHIAGIKTMNVELLLHQQEGLLAQRYDLY